MDWIRLDASFRTHPKVSRLTKRLGCTRAMAVAALVNLWLWCAYSREDGCLDGLEAADLDEICDWEGGPGLLQGLIDSGWLELIERRLYVHEWMDYQSKCERARLLHARRQANYKARVTLQRQQGDGGVTQVSHDGRTDGRTRQTENNTLVQNLPALGLPMELPDPDAVKDADVRAVFAHYLKVMGLNQGAYRLTASRRTTIRKRLTECEVDYLCAAIDACGKSAYHMGQNPANRPYNDIVKNILKSEEKVEWWVNGRNGGNHGR
jgi:hypothetical protein